MKKVFKFVKGKKDEKRGDGCVSGIPSSQSRDLSSPARTPEDEKFLGLDVASSSGYIVDFCGKDKSLTKLHKAAWQGHLDKLKSALKKFEIDAVDRHNRSALHFAVVRGHPNIVWYLLGNDAKLTICDDDGCTPLLKAIECGHKDCMTLLLERGADINDSDYRGNTGLHAAAKRGSLDVISALLSRGAALDVANNAGEYPLHIATSSQNRDLVELFLRAGASANVFDRENRTPLMLAAKTGNLQLARLFREHGAQLTVVDSNGWTAEDYALLGGHENVAQELKSYTASETAESAVAREKGPEDEEEEETSDPGKSNENRNDGSSTSSESKARFEPDREKKIAAEQEKEEDELSDSPEGSMPPPCRPPRSWEIIQAGMIDANQEGSEAKRLNITALGTLRSRRESFSSEAGNAAQGEPAKYTLSLNRRRPVKRENSFAKQRLSFNEEESLKSWTSDASAATLKEIDRMDLGRIGKFSVDRTRGTPEVGSDWDSDAASGATPPVIFAANNSFPKTEKEEKSNSFSASKTFSEVRGGQTAKEDNSTSWDSQEFGDGAMFPSPPSGLELGVNMAKSIGCMKGMSIDQPTGNFVDRRDSAVSRESRHSHSLDRSDGTVSGDSRSRDVSLGNKRHVRHASISACKWKSEEIPQQSKLLAGRADVDRRIEEQLQCYDEALRELAGTPFDAGSRFSGKTRNYYSLPTCRSSASRPPEKETGFYYDRGERLPGGSGPLSLPFCVNRALPPKSDEEDGEESVKESTKSKRMILLAMREVKHAVHLANAFETSADEDVLSPLAKPPLDSDFEDEGTMRGKAVREEKEEEGEDEDEEEEERRHFFRSDYGSRSRQETVVEVSEPRRKSSSSGTGEEPTLWLQEGGREVSSDSEDELPRCREDDKDEANDIRSFAEDLVSAAGGGGNFRTPSPETTRRRRRGESSSPERPFPKRDRERDEQEEEDEEDQNREPDRDDRSPDISLSSGPIEPIGGGKDSGSEADSSHNEVSPAHKYTLQVHHEWLKNHLKTTTTEKNKLEQVAVELSEKAERLQYELADAKEATRSKDEVISLLRNQLARMESAYTKSLEESVQSRLQLATHEQEILHLKELCFKYEEEKEKTGGAEADEPDCSELKSRIRLLEEEKEKMMREILRLEQEKSSLEKRLQEDTTSEILDQCQRWKERCENLESSAKANEEAQTAYLSFLKSVGVEHAERERKLRDRNADLEKMLSGAKERTSELEAKLKSLTDEMDNEKLKNRLRKELTGSVTEIERRNAELESQIRRLEREVEEKNLKTMREKEEEMQNLIKEFAIEREAMTTAYERRLAESKCEGSRQVEESRKKEYEKLMMMVKQLKEQFSDLKEKSFLGDTNEAVKSEVNALKEKCELVSEVVAEIQNKGKQEMESLARENLELKKKMDLLRERVSGDDGRLGTVQDSSASEVARLKKKVRSMDDALDRERTLLRECRETNAGLERQIGKLTAEAKQYRRGEPVSDARPGKKRAAVKEDELAWSNLYGIKLAGKGRENSIPVEVAGMENGDRVRTANEGVLQEKKSGAEMTSPREEETERKAGEEVEERFAKRDLEMLELKRQIAMLQSRMAEEMSVRRALETKFAEVVTEARQKERSEPGESVFACDAVYKAKCERFAKEMEKTKEIRRSLETGNRGLECVFADRSGLGDSITRTEASRPIPPPPSTDLEPEIKTRLNEELERSIKRHLADVAVTSMSDAEGDLLRKLLR